MTENAIRTWLSAYDLTAEQNVLANLAYVLAAEFDEKGNTSTAAELRKTVQAIAALLAPTNSEYDPLNDLLKR